MNDKREELLSEPQSPDQNLAARMKIGPDQLTERRAFLDFSQTDVELLRDLDKKLAGRHLALFDGFYEYLQTFPKLRQMLGSPERVERLKQAQVRYFKRLTAGEYDEDYVAQRLQVGLTHQRVGLEPHWYLAGFQSYLGQLRPVIQEIYQGDRARAEEVYAAVSKVAFFDMGLAIDTYIHADRSRALEMEKGFRDVIEHSPDGIVIHRQDHVVYVNPALLAAMGIESDQSAIGRSIFDFICPGDREKVRKLNAELRRNKEPGSPQETTLIRGDGSPLYAEVTGVSLEFDGAPAIVSLVRNITERKELNARIMQMDRMIAAGTLAAGVGHEINNPLTYVKANLDFSLRRLDDFVTYFDGLHQAFQDRFDPDEVAEIFDALGTSRIKSELGQVREALQDAEQGSRRIRDIVSQLRSLVDKDQSEGCTRDNKRIFEKTIALATNQIRHRARLIEELDEVPPIRGRESELSQVILNLLINAAQSIEEGSVEDNQIYIRSYLRDDDLVAIEVEDTGQGIEAEHLPRIFDPFFTTKEVGVGTGLGLHISQNIIDRCGGRIEVESTPGEGTLFRVLIPCCDLHDQGFHDPDSQPIDADARRQILIIDDDQLSREALRRLLSRHHDVTLADSGRQGLELLEGGAQFDLILCDLMMPQMTGMDFYEALQARYPEFLSRVAFMSGGAFTSRARNFVAAITTTYLDKPIRSQQLHSLIAKSGTASKTSSSDDVLK